MDMVRDDIEILCIPDTAKCCADDKERNPQDISVCPEGHTECNGDCEYYTE